MLVEIFLAALVLAVAVLMVVDVARAPAESPLWQPDTRLRDAGPAISGLPGGTGATTSLRVPAGPVRPAARDAGPAPRAESPSTAGRATSPAVPPEVRRRSSRELKNWSVQSRLLLLVGIPAVAVAVVAFCVVRLVDVADSTSIHSPVGSVRDGAIASEIGFGAAAVIVLALAAWCAIVAARSVLQPLGKLRAGARELPDAVRRVSASNGQGGPPPVKPIDVDSSDELGEVARAFDQMRSETLRMTANEAVVRDKLNTMLMNLSHRSQSLAERQIRLIDSLGQGEQDAGRLASLSKMDRIAARMHRGSQNLLVLAGRDSSERWHQPVALVNVIRAAVSEIEDEERVSLGGVPDIAVRGPAVNDVVHLLAELTENATLFSSGDMLVDVSSRVLTTGGTLIEITDRGIGMAPSQMAQANWQLENLQTVDADIPKWVGLSVVAKLAARHGIRVRLHAAEFGGLTALVWLPDEILTRKGAADRRTAGSMTETPVDPRYATTSDPRTAGSLADTVVDARYATAQDGAVTVTATGFAPQPEGIRGASAGGRSAGDANQPSDPGWPVAGLRPVSPAGSGAAATPAGLGPTRTPGQIPDLATPAGLGPTRTDGQIPDFATPAGLGSTRADGQIPDFATPAGLGPTGTDGQIPDFGTPLAATVDDGAADPGALPVPGSPAPGETEVSALSASPPASQETASAHRDVIVPPAEGHEEARKLPIFDEVESRWFGAGRLLPGRPAAGNRWSSPADEGWHAAQTADVPTSVGSTSAGLPRRMPAANLIPGAIPNAQPPAAPARSAAEARDRLGGFQRGVSEGRAAADEAASQPGDDPALVSMIG
jgi:signal transduction histidine kinase